jgi:spoIIIJ-associated protein
VAAPARPAPPGDESAEAQLARELLGRAVDAIGVPASLAIQDREEVEVTLVGPDVSVLIGRHGQTLDALQYLANALAARAGLERRVVVDAAGYRARRTSTLEALARRSAEQASATSREVALESMTAVERKIVHEALKDDPEVETASEGTEPNRYVVVIPRRNV